MSEMLEVAMVLSNPTCHVRAGEIGSTNIRRAY